MHLPRLLATLVAATALTAMAPNAGATTPSSSGPIMVGSNGHTWTPAAPRDTDPSADALPTVQLDNGVARTTRIVGNTVYVGGEFTNTRPAGAAKGTNLTPRANLMSFDLRTGALGSLSADTDKPVLALAASPNGKRLYVGGSFTTIQGQTRYRLAAIDLATGKVITSFQPYLNTTVQSLVVTNDTVYAGGDFQRAGNNDTVRTFAAAFDADTGALRPWNPRANAPVRTMVMNPDKQHIILGGNFTMVDGWKNPGTAKVDLVKGDSAYWGFNHLPVDINNSNGIYNLSADEDSVYVAAYGTSTNVFEGVARLEYTHGEIMWLADCHGDSYSTAPMAGRLYVAGHAHDCQNNNTWLQDAATPWDPATLGANLYTRASAFDKEPFGTTGTNTQNVGKYADQGGRPAAASLVWNPILSAGSYTGTYQAAWTNDAANGYVVYGGEFPRVNGKAQYGLVRFAAPALDGHARKVGAQDKVVVTAKATADGIDNRFVGTWDADGTKLVYKLYRSDAPSTPIATTTHEQVFGQRVWYQQLDHPAATTPVSYRVDVIDSDGNTVRGDWSAAVTPAR